MNTWHEIDDEDRLGRERSYELALKLKSVLDEHVARLEEEGTIDEQSAFTDVRFAMLDLAANIVVSTDMDSAQAMRFFADHILLYQDVFANHGETLLVHETPLASPQEPK